MKPFKSYINENLETSKFRNTDPRSVNSLLSVGFCILPLRKFQNTALRTNYCYNLNRRDGWFRKIEGSGQGYGLMIRDVRTSKKMPTVWAGGSIHLYPVNVTYLPIEFNRDEEKFYQKDQMTVYINTDIDSTVTIDDVIKYCKENAATWNP